MGQTLDNGIYLPSEGERNCYDGLAANWTTLDVVVGGYRAHIANENIHITSAERNKWDNGVTQAYVLRYANTSLTALGTVAFSALDNTDNIKIGDKVLDSEGKLFALTAVDTANSTATLSALLIDLSKDSDLSNYYTKPETDTLLSNKANDSDVVHKSGNETVGGEKTFTNSIILQNSDTSGLSRAHLSKSQIAVLGDVGSSDNTKYIFVDKNNKEICYIRQRKLTNSNTDMSFCVNNIDNDNNSISAEINFIIDRNNDPRISPSLTDFISLGRPTFRWKSIYSNLVNGLTPSSLSLPNYPAGKVDISAYITDLSGANNYYTAPANGYVFIRTTNGTYLKLLEYPSGVCSSVCSQTADDIGTFLPVNANRICIIAIKCSSIDRAYFIPCHGNV